jgi:hypothetical protein
MSDQITTAFVNDYKSTVELLLQQKGSKLRGAVTVGSYTGKGAKAVEQIGAVNARKRTTRHGDTPLIATPHAARWVFPTDYEWADLIDDQDKLRMIIDPSSAYAVNGAYALGRAIDDELIGAFFATAKVGENGTTDEAFDTTNHVVGVDVGGTASGLNIAKLRAAKKILVKNEVDVENDPLFIAITAEQHDDLLGETQAISLDYNTRPVLVDGKITSFMGFNFIPIELGSSAFANASSTLSSTTRYCPCWAKSGMHLGIWNDITTKVSERADKSYSWQVYCKGTFGATRTQAGKVIRISCAE